MTPSNSADFGELPLSSAYFQVLERSNLGPILNEFTLAYNLGDPDQARKMLKMGKLKSTKYVVKFDILKTEQVAAAQQGFDGRSLGAITGILGGFGRGASAAGVGVGSVQTSESSGVWIIGMRYKIINAETTEQVATGYTEEKMEVGAKSTSVLVASRPIPGARPEISRRRRPATRPSSPWAYPNEMRGSSAPSASSTTTVARPR